MTMLSNFVGDGDSGNTKSDLVRLSWRGVSQDSVKK